MNTFNGKNEEFHASFFSSRPAARKVGNNTFQPKIGTIIVAWLAGELSLCFPRFFLHYENIDSLGPSLTVNCVSDILMWPQFDHILLLIETIVVTPRGKEQTKISFNLRKCSTNFFGYKVEIEHLEEYIVLIKEVVQNGIQNCYDSKFFIGWRDKGQRTLLLHARKLGK